MNAPTSGFFVAAVAAAVIDWTAVARGWRRVELASKPVTILLFLAAAATVSPEHPGQRTFFLLGLALSTVGDVILLGPARWFAAGLAAFLGAHLAYIAGLLQVDGSSESLAAGLLFVLLADVFVGVPIVRGAARRRGIALGVAVAAYLAVLSTTVVVAGLSDIVLARIGAVLLYASDGVLGWNRFVLPFPRGRLVTRVLYHAGQAMLVLSLVA